MVLYLQGNRHSIREVLKAKKVTFFSNSFFFYSNVSVQERKTKTEIKPRRTMDFVAVCEDASPPSGNENMT